MKKLSRHVKKSVDDERLQLMKSLAVVVDTDVEG